MLINFESFLAMWRIQIQKESTFICVAGYGSPLKKDPDPGVKKLPSNFEKM
jgi:hypothetical protein